MNRKEAEDMLKPCPCCGGKAYINPFGSTRYHVKCFECDLNTKTVEINPEYSAYDKLVEMWNSRYSDLAKDGRIAETKHDDLKVISDEELEKEFL